MYAESPSRKMAKQLTPTRKVLTSNTPTTTSIQKRGNAITKDIENKLQNPKKYKNMAKTSIGHKIIQWNCLS